jgi:hypothetical protein
VAASYDATPADSVMFASTGGDGVHFSALDSDGAVVMTVPMAFDSPNHVLGKDIPEFLALGRRTGYFHLDRYSIVVPEAGGDHGTVSQYFKDVTTGETLWNPATRVAQLFFRVTDAMVRVAERPCGVVDLQIDEYAVEPEAFAVFVDSLVTQYLASNHPIFKAMLAGYLPQAVVMVERSGRSVAALTVPIERSTEAISLNVDAFDPAGDRQDLVERATAAARSMPTS